MMRKTVHSLDWFKSCCKTIEKSFIRGKNWQGFIVPEMSVFCGKEVTWDGQNILEDNNAYVWQEWMFEHQPFPQIRVIHSAKWVKRNCIKSKGGCWYFVENYNPFVKPMFAYCGKIICWDGRYDVSKGNGWVWEEWMLKPYRTKEQQHVFIK
jgi:hypothetical protein